VNRKSKGIGKLEASGYPRGTHISLPAQYWRDSRVREIRVGSQRFSRRLDADLHLLVKCGTEPQRDAASLLKGFGMPENSAAIILNCHRSSLHDLYLRYDSNTKKPGMKEVFARAKAEATKKWRTS
jgi:hypothetical protein